VREKQDRVDQFSVVLVAVAAVMWASDAYFRSHLVTHLSPAQIVVAEDALVCVFLVPVLARRAGELRRLGGRGWAAAIVIGVGPQAVATVLFTASFSYGIYAETYVLQQTQPIIAITLAWLILGERRRPWFWIAVAVALGAVYMVVFANNLTAPFSALQKGRLEAGLLALGAAALWAGGTVLGRVALGRASFPAVTGLRFTIALPVLVAILLVQSGAAGFSHYRPGDFPNLLGIALIPGLLALLLYYRALASTPASLATIAEMAFPVTATLIASLPSPVGFAQPIYPAQILGTVLLIAVVGFLNWSKVNEPAVIVPRTKVSPATLG
jgi:DME family drug/metabolite transporter